jgi:hypothetical protein
VYVPNPVLKNDFARKGPFSAKLAPEEEIWAKLHEEEFFGR